MISGYEVVGECDALANAKKIAVWAVVGALSHTTPRRCDNCACNKYSD
jgi:hypothetical protein